MSSKDESSADENPNDGLKTGNTGTENLTPFREPKKRKKRKQTAASRGPTGMSASRGTGFEEYFADPPMTPAEVEDERLNIYAPDLPFEQRIESCLHRFRSRRRLSTQHAHFFNEYLLLGGIDSNPNAFTGVNQRDLKQFTPAERRELRAVDGIHTGGDGTGRFYDGDDEHWSVDFTAIAQGFLSVSVVSLTGLEERPLEMAIALLENFLRYVLQHDVCPEYEEDVNGALKVCQQAREEWPLIRKLHALLPGELQNAAAELFHFRDRDDWAKIEHGDDESSGEDQMKDGVSAKATVFTTLALLKGEEEKFQALVQAWTSGKLTTRVIDCAIQLKSVERASEDARDRFSRLQINDSRIPAIGRAIFTPTTITDGWDKPDRYDPSASIPSEITLYLDDRILKSLVPCMKMNVTLVEIVEVGIYFLKKSGPVLPSFYRFLPQELMKQYREPRESDKAAPSIHDRGPEKEDLAPPADGNVGCT